MVYVGEIFYGSLTSHNSWLKILGHINTTSERTHSSWKYDEGRCHNLLHNGKLFNNVK
jgi:hypothetical protein